jgi:hypothetical protein
LLNDIFRMEDVLPVFKVDNSFTKEKIILGNKNLHMKNFYFTILLILSLQVQAQNAQTKDSIVYKDSTRFYEHGYVGLTFMNNQPFSGLNNKAQQYFPRAIPQNLIGISIGGKSVFGPGIFHGEIILAGGTKGSRNNGRTSLFQGNLSLDAGLMLTPPGSIRVYPFAGVGGDFAVATFKASARNIHFDSLMSNAATREGMKPVSFSAFFLTWRTGLAIDITTSASTQRAVSIRAGYRQSFNNARWNFEGDNGFIGTPTDRLNQWFGSVVFYGKPDKIKKRITK